MMNWLLTAALATFGGWSTYWILRGLLEDWQRTRRRIRHLQHVREERRAR